LGQRNSDLFINMGDILKISLGILNWQGGPRAIFVSITVLGDYVFLNPFRFDTKKTCRIIQNQYQKHFK